MLQLTFCMQHISVAASPPPLPTHPHTHPPTPPPPHPHPHPTSPNSNPLCSNAPNIANFHKMQPRQPVAATECCSCESQRGEDSDQPHDNATVFQTNEIQKCLLDETQRFNSQEFNAGQFIWTLHDYIGELVCCVSSAGCDSTNYSPLIYQCPLSRPQT